MKKSTIAASILVALMTLPLGLIGCAEDTDADDSSGFVGEVLDSVAAAVAENIIDSHPALATETTIETPVETTAVELAVKVAHADAGLPPINDLFVEGSLVYAGFDGGLLIYDLKSQDFSIAPVDEDLQTLTTYGGDLLAGGENLYRVDGPDLLPMEDEIPGQITAMCGYGPSLMIGTTEGLYARNLLGCVSLLEEVEISALVVDNDGLWIGTAGDGLYRWDGERYKRRYLGRDAALLDHVTALDFNHNHLYVGTPAGMYVYDGGRWQTITAEDGLPGNQITAIDASGWVVYVGTDNGLVKYFDKEISPVERLGGHIIMSIGRSGDRIIAGTAQHGLILKTGPSIKTLIEPWQDGSEELASIIH